MMDQQLYLAIGAPMLFNAILVGVLMAHIQSVRNELRAEFRAEMGGLRTELRGLQQRFDDVRDLA